MQKRPMGEQETASEGSVLRIMRPKTRPEGHIDVCLSGPAVGSSIGTERVLRRSELLLY
jgi:hypothetical protein